MESLTEWPGVIASVITILSTLVGITLYLSRITLRGDLLKQRQKFEADLAEKQTAILDLESTVQKLSHSLQLIRSGKESALNIINELDGLLEEIRNITGATADSILIKNPYVIDTLIFLVIHGKAANKIRGMMVPISGSQAGSVFIKGEPSFFNHAVKSNSLHYEDTDEHSGYKSNNILSIPFKAEGKAIGVLQLLNKKDGKHFEKIDLMQINNLCSEISPRVLKLVNDPTSLKSLGIIERSEEAIASILFADITNFSSSFENLSNVQITELVNEYFNRLCDISLSYGGTIDKFLGDGFIIRFNIPRLLDGYVDAAVKSAFMMQQEFACLKKEWGRQGLPIAKISNRIGIATGSVIGGIMGHPQYVSFTVMGNSVNLAAKLCELAHNSHSGILICNTTLEKCSHELREIMQPKKLENGNLFGFDISKVGVLKFQRRRTDPN